MNNLWKLEMQTFETLESKRYIIRHGVITIHNVSWFGEQEWDNIQGRVNCNQRKWPDYFWRVRAGVLSKLFIPASTECDSVIAWTSNSKGYQWWGGGVLCWTSALNCASVCPDPTSKMCFWNVSENFFWFFFFFAIHVPIICFSDSSTPDLRANVFFLEANKFWILSFDRILRLNHEYIIERKQHLATLRRRKRSQKSAKIATLRR